MSVKCMLSLTSLQPTRPSKHLRQSAAGACGRPPLLAAAAAATQQEPVPLLLDLLLLLQRDPALFKSGADSKVEPAPRLELAQNYLSEGEPSVPVHYATNSITQKSAGCSLKGNHQSQSTTLPTSLRY